VLSARSGDAVSMEDEPRLEWEDLTRILLLLMKIDAKLDELLGWEDDDAEEEGSES
jgi:hypothetical protein